LKTDNLAFYFSLLFATNSHFSVLLLSQAERTARMKAETKERTLKRFLLSQKHIVYTEPLDVHAGSTVSVFYNPANTVLNGKPEVWFRGSFNRWTHRRGPLLPQRMLPADNGTHVRNTGECYMFSYHFFSLIWRLKGFSLQCYWIY
jgi:hypothetical protein